jgi:glycosyltransferase involved in cell wall biosynthesis
LKIGLPYFPEPLGSDSGGGTYKLHEIFRHEFVKQGHDVFLFDFHGSTRENKFYGPGVYIHVPFSTDRMQQAAKIFIGLCQELDIQVIIPLNEGMITSVIPHLPLEMKIVMHCNSIVPHAYYHVTRYPKHVSKIVVESLRQKLDLEENWDVPRNSISIAPNGIQPKLKELHEKNYDGILQIGYLGRIENASKGTDLIPGIVKYLISKGIDFDLEVIGSGPDEKKLKDSLTSLTDRVSFSGSVRSDEVLSRLSQKHILIMPSRIEGFGFVAIEAMSVGVVPVVSRISGVLDWIVTDGVTGQVRDLAPPKEFGDAIIGLDLDRNLLREMSRNAFLEVIQRFSLSEMVRIHLTTCESAIISYQPERPAPLPFEEWRPFEEWNPSIYYKIQWRLDKALTTILRGLRY